MANTPENDPSSPAQKPAIKTLEGKLALAMAFLGALLTFLAALYDQGMLGDGKLAGVIGAVLALGSTLGLIAGRSYVKASGNTAAALVEAARSGPSKPQQ